MISNRFLYSATFIPSTDKGLGWGWGESSGSSSSKGESLQLWYYQKTTGLWIMIWNTVKIAKMRVSPCSNDHFIDHGAKTPPPLFLSPPDPQTGVESPVQNFSFSFAFQRLCLPYFFPNLMICSLCFPSECIQVFECQVFPDDIKLIFLQTWTFFLPGILQ